MMASIGRMGEGGVQLGQICPVHMCVFFMSSGKFLEKSTSDKEHFVILGKKLTFVLKGQKWGFFNKFNIFLKISGM